MRGGEKVLAILRIVVYICMFDTASIFQSILLIPSLSLSFCISIYIIDHRTIELRNIGIKNNRYMHTYIYIYTANCRFSFYTRIYACIGALKVKAKRQRRSYLTDLINSVVEIIIILFQARHRLSPSLGATY
jgi:hypothetical protein